MKYEIVFAVCFACTLLLETQAKPTLKCEPGSFFKISCNECKCSADGTDMACTRQLCPPDNEETKPAQEKQDESTKDEPCTPGQTYKKGCNDCTCPPSGLKSSAVCTLLACIDDFKKVDETS